MENKNVRKPSLLVALIPILFLIPALYLVLTVYEGSPHLALLAAAAVAAGVAVFLGHKWEDIEQGIVSSLSSVTQAIIILMIIGCIIGVWILSGIVPTMIYYGLQMLSPSIFFIAACIICSIVSIATGSSWTTAGTVGVALMGVGAGLGMNPAITAGAIISGAYFGDKMSPLSDTTNLAPAVSGANLFDHIKHMAYTTGAAYVISLVLYGILGLRNAGNAADVSVINGILEGLSANFTISPLLLLAPVLVIVMVVLKVPAIPGLVGGTVLGGIFAWLFQGACLRAITEAVFSGFSIEVEGAEMLTDLLSGGGLENMLWTVSLIMCAMIFGGIMEKTGMLEAITGAILKYAKSNGSLILATVLSCLTMNAITSDQYLSIVIPGKMYAQTYRDRGLHPKSLSRALEDSGTLTSALIPWNTCGAFMMGALGIGAWVYVPYAFLNILNPIISVIYGYTGFTIEMLKDKAAEKAA